MRIMWKFALAIISKNTNRTQLLLSLCYLSYQFFVETIRGVKLTLLVIFLIVRSETRMKVLCCCVCNCVRKYKRFRCYIVSLPAFHGILHTQKKRKIHFKILLNIFYSWMLFSKWIKFLIRVSELCYIFHFAFEN